MTFDEYQKEAWKTAMYPEKKNNLYYPALGLGEAGEIQNKVKKVMRDHDGKVSPEMRLDLKKELGDLLWYIAAMATELDLTVEDIAIANIEKLFSRKERGKIQGEGDDR